MGLQDEFLLLGGDSLRAHRVLTRLRRRFGLELPLTRFFETRSVADQARLVEELRAADPAPGRPPSSG